MMGSMMDMMNQMSGMMKGASPEQMKSMSMMVADMSQNMMQLSKMMNNGMASEKDMKAMQDTMSGFQMKLDAGMKK